MTTNKKLDFKDFQKQDVKFDIVKLQKAYRQLLKKNNIAI